MSSVVVSLRGSSLGVPSRPRRYFLPKYSRKWRQCVAAWLMVSPTEAGIGPPHGRTTGLESTLRAPHRPRKAYRESRNPRILASVPFTLPATPKARADKPPAAPAQDKDMSGITSVLITLRVMFSLSRCERSRQNPAWFNSPAVRVTIRRLACRERTPCRSSPNVAYIPKCGAALTQRFAALIIAPSGWECEPARTRVASLLTQRTEGTAYGQDRVVARTVDFARYTGHA